MKKISLILLAVIFAFAGSAFTAKKSSDVKYFNNGWKDTTATPCDSGPVESCFAEIPEEEDEIYQLFDENHDPYSRPLGR